MHIPLFEMTPEEATEHATKVFLDVSILCCSGSCFFKLNIIPFLLDCLTSTIKEMPNLPSSQ